MAISHVKVAHAWAHQTGKGNQAKGHNMLYEGDTIYSYGSHFPIARLIPNNDGDPIVLFTTRTYGATTAKHLSYTRRAIPREWTVLRVHDPRATDFESDYDASLGSAKDCMAKASHARTRGDQYLAGAQEWIENANGLDKLFSLNHGPVSLETLGLAVADVEARIAAAKLRQAEAERVQLVKRNHEQAERRADWLKGSLVYFNGTDDDGRALLRVKDDWLETSQGAHVPLSHAIYVFKIMAQCKAQNKSWPRDFYADNQPFARPRVGDYRVDTIDADGTLHAGCHVIGWSEAERIATQIGVLAA